MSRKKGNKEEQQPQDTNLVVTAQGIQEIQPVPEAQALDLDTLTSIYQRGSFEVIQALFSQASLEAERLESIRKNLKRVEEKLYDPLNIETMSNDELSRIADLSQKAVGGSTNYLFKLQNGMTTCLEVIGTLQKSQQSSTNAKIDNPDLDLVKRELGDILLQKIKEKAAE